MVERDLPPLSVLLRAPSLWGQSSHLWSKKQRAQLRIQQYEENHNLCVCVCLCAIAHVVFLHHSDKMHPTHDMR